MGARVDARVAAMKERGYQQLAREITQSQDRVLDQFRKLEATIDTRFAELERNLQHAEESRAR